MPERLHLPCIYARKRRRTRASLESSAEVVTAADAAQVTTAEILPSAPPVRRRSERTTASGRSPPAPVPSVPVPSPAPIGAHVPGPLPASIANGVSRSPPRASFLLPTYASTPAVSATSDERSPVSQGIHNTTVGFLNPAIEPSRPPTPEVEASLRPAGVYADDDPSAFMPSGRWEEFAVTDAADSSIDGAPQLD